MGFLSRASTLSSTIAIRCNRGDCQFKKANYLPRAFGGFSQALQSATQKLQTYVLELEAKIDQLQKKK